MNEDINGVGQSGDIEDVAACVRAGRSIRPGVRYRIQIGDENLVFASAVIDAPVVTGWQLIEAAGKHPVDEHLVFQLLKDGALENLRLEEITDLRGGGVERFLIFHAAESYRCELDGRVLEWGAPKIGEAVLRTLAGVPENYRVWQERRAEEDFKLPRGSYADLTPAGLERFYTGVEETTSGLTNSFLPEKDRRYLSDHNFVVEEVEHAGQKGLIFRNYPLPAGIFDQPVADVLVLLPTTWPDSSTDMFYLFPWVKVHRTGAYADNAATAQEFGGRSWQRWSRHNSVWRRGRDGIWTVLRRVDAALRAV
jgi:hypothetical protein